LVEGSHQRPIVAWLASADVICQTAASMADRHDSASCLADLRVALSYDAFGYAYPFAWRFS
jgi:hypothetical protein